MRLATRHLIWAQTGQKFLSPVRGDSPKYIVIFNPIGDFLAAGDDEATFSFTVSKRVT